MRDPDHLAVQPGDDPTYPLVVEQTSPGPFITVVTDLGPEVRVMTTCHHFPLGAVGFGHETDLHHGAQPALRPGWSTVAGAQSEAGDPP